jgi:hypothetical protein
VTETPADSSPAFAMRYLRLLTDAGWRVALHVLPYAVAAGVITEGFLRLRIVLVWKLPLALTVIACLHLATLLGAHVAALRAAGPGSTAMPPVRHHLRAAGRITGESALMLLVVLVAALAMVGTLDLAVAITDPVLGARWPGLVLRGIAILAALMVTGVLLVGAMALAASFDGRSVGFARVLRMLLARSDRATGVLSAVIVGGTLAVLLVTVAMRVFDPQPPIIGAALAKAAGYLVAVITLSVGAAAIAAAE